LSSVSGLLCSPGLNFLNYGCKVNKVFLLSKVWWWFFVLIVKFCVGVCDLLSG